MSKKILHLTLKKKWFDLIAAGKKKLEFRKGKAYWAKRLLGKDGFAIKFDEVHFRNGYGRNSPFCRVEWKNLGVFDDDGQWEHGEIFEKGDFAIALGNVLEVRR